MIFEKFTAFPLQKICWDKYPGVVDVWKRNYAHVEQLYDYGSAVRKIMYTTNAIEAINSSFRKVTKKGAFPNETTLFKLLYLRVSELEKKWSTGYIANWSMVLNQLMVNDSFKERIDKYIKFQCWKRKKASSEFYLPFSACTLKISIFILNFMNEFEIFKITYTVYLTNPHSTFTGQNLPNMTYTWLVTFPLNTTFLTTLHRSTIINTGTLNTAYMGFSCASCSF